MKEPAEIQALVDSLGYDFDQFELLHFLHHIESLRNRQIILRPYPFAEVLFGLWVRAPSADYIIYSNDCHPIHQIHTILHEVGHMILGHPPRRLDQVLPPELLKALGLLEPAGHSRLAPGLSVKTTPEERECEIFASLIQAKVVEKNRLHQLTGQNSSLTSLKPYADSVNPGRVDP